MKITCFSRFDELFPLHTPVQIVNKDRQSYGASRQAWTVANSFFQGATFRLEWKTLSLKAEDSGSKPEDKSISRIAIGDNGITLSFCPPLQIQNQQLIFSNTNPTSIVVQGCEKLSQFTNLSRHLLFAIAKKQGWYKLTLPRFQDLSDKAFRNYLSSFILSGSKTKIDDLTTILELQENINTLEDLGNIFEVSRERVRVRIKDLIRYLLKAEDLPMFLGTDCNREAEIEEEDHDPVSLKERKNQVTKLVQLHYSNWVKACNFLNGAGLTSLEGNS
jgi:hypothetical protein